MTGINTRRVGGWRERAAGACGFTVIELLVVVSIIVILASIAMAQYRNSVIRAQEVVLLTDLHHMRDAIDQYYADKQQYPATLDALVTEGYLRQIPKDPITGSADTWQAIQADADVANPAAEPGIANVKSGADRTAFDGTRYSDW